MGVEIEKKYRLTEAERASLLERLRKLPADEAVQKSAEEFEENTIFAGPRLETGQKSVLRLRLAGGRALLTYKERYSSASAIKHQREDETEVTDAEAMRSILEALGYRPALVYEKRRTTWAVYGVELVIDELPFGLFAEIEGAEESIIEAEQRLGLATAAAELSTYPELAALHGTRRGALVAARFTRAAETA